VGPKRVNSRDRSPDSNTSKALLARKETIRGTEILPRKSKCSTKDKIVEKPCAYSGHIEGRNKKNLERDPAKKPPEYKGHIPLRLERLFSNPCPLGRKELTFSKRDVTADDTLRRVVASSSAGAA
jgi:hypothetical protein